VVTHDIMQPGVYAGNPARLIRLVSAGQSHTETNSAAEERLS
jgi:acetyltransferase-like isoleucine patch superfamily enzyme